MAMQKVPDLHIGFDIPGIGGISFDIPIPVYFESFSHRILMDFAIINASLGKWEDNLDLMEQELTNAHNVVNSDLRLSWQGHSATEFFAAYEPMYKSFTDQLVKLRAMSKLLHEEIVDFGDMQKNFRS
jgi:uncharacterized protein YukE